MEQTQIQPYLKNSPIVILSEKEFQTFLIKFGSFLCLINNKTINPTFLFFNLVQKSDLQKIFQDMSGIPTLMENLRLILTTYPNLVKSKIVKENSIKFLKNKKTSKLKKDNGTFRKSKTHL